MFWHEQRSCGRKEVVKEGPRSCRMGIKGWPEEPRIQTPQGHPHAKDLDIWKESDRKPAMAGVEAAAEGGEWVVNERGENSPGNSASR